MSRGASALNPLADPDPQTGNAPPAYMQVRRTRRMLKDVTNIRIAYMNLVSRVDGNVRVEDFQYALDIVTGGGGGGGGGGGEDGHSLPTAEAIKENMR